ncbi:nitrilase [Sulfolobus sp. A20]|uniref:carbon-nitrogen hydrolase family protein n=1 Tax=Sulfolobaceae TaxID=118883 RepID=UPI000845E95B|nr:MULTISPECIES: carbon-nitrogen hydrolase family protein [unclassified Sulfolobus]TRM77358.1 carbon-nitrogen hydrolase family protein [Sulfolobus sp. A20-N-F8]TRM79181.1 carbon-nitrogen hydrolase family protein [Sulfolobus sp. B5]TRM85246.1 carbon-nitrogen hydrolase family protein [Sulfolobus sp. F3]TRM86904.1 carbon-nitrogen hydrolase family protein [Sulfolobus sp. E3]TRM94585.1 carbon-nitrogen hydrolase family protein [Sulfolobus sp. A20-N-G8]TRN00660.1 carbon-nitrogen hydrolase family pro
MKIGVIQPSNARSALNLTEKALEEGAELVLLPEKWTKSLDEVPLSEFQNLARKYTAYIIPGAFEDGVSVVSPIIDDTGNLKGISKKVHLFEEEKTRLFPGNEGVMFTYRGIKFGISICYDVDFPEFIREMFLNGVEIVLVPSKVRSTGIQIWKDYLRIRVLENRIGIVNANAYNPPEFTGNSIVIVPEKDNNTGIVLPKILGELGNEENYLVVNVDPLRFIQLRKNRLNEVVKFTIKQL